ncbi:MAG TPA: hypothetical protein VFE86_08410 [Ilumatobacteraceae bacterium]|nr:hypothetical protein [Ilumatobacteraceae bacterium]
MASRALLCVALVVGMAPACSNAGSSSRATSSAPPDVGVAPESSVATTSVANTIVATTSVADVTGVPGLGVTDPFCAAWAAYAGTLQALGVAGSFGALSSGQLAVLELRAAPRLVEAASAIEAAWPAELAAERDLVLDRRVGPYARRAQRAVDALVDAGATPADIAGLSSSWQQALSTRTQADAVIDLPAVDAALQPRLDAAASAFDAAFTPFASDPSLVVDSLKSPLTDAYLAAHCPDVASSGVGDAL